MVVVLDVAVGVEVVAVAVEVIVDPEVVKTVPVASAVIDAVDLSSRTSPSPLSGIVPLSTTVGRET